MSPPLNKEGYVGMPMLTSALLTSALASLPLVIEKVPCPELGEDVFAYVKMLTCAEAELAERVAGEHSTQQLGALRTTGQIAASPDTEEPAMAMFEARAVLDDPPAIRIPLVAAALCDEMGNCLVTTDEQRHKLGTLAPSLIRRLHDAAWKLNSTGDDEVMAAVKNFARRQTSDSGTGWHVNGVALSESASNS